MNIKSLPDIPYTLSFVIRKRQQIDSYRELPSDKQPTDEMIWDSTPEELDSWFKRMMNKKEQSDIKLDLSEIEG